MTVLFFCPKSPRSSSRSGRGETDTNMKFFRGFHAIFRLEIWTICIFYDIIYNEAGFCFARSALGRIRVLLHLQSA